MLHLEIHSCKSPFKDFGIQFSGKPLGFPKKVPETNREGLKRLKAQQCEDYLQYIPIEGKFDQGKNGYRLNYIRAKRAGTSFAGINVSVYSKTYFSQHGVTATVDFYIPYWRSIMPNTRRSNPRRDRSSREQLMMQYETSNIPQRH